MLRGPLTACAPQLQAKSKTTPGSAQAMAQTSARSKLQPVPAVQPSPISATVQSLAPAVWQMASASAKVLSRLHPHAEPGTADSPHTEQLDRMDSQLGSSMSEQHRTCGRGQRGTRSARTQARDGMDALQAHLVQRVQFLGSWRLVAASIIGIPAHGGGFLGIRQRRRWRARRRRRWRGRRWRWRWRRRRRRWRG